MALGVTLAGWCDGGPLHGVRLAHDASRYRVVVREPYPVPVLELLEFAQRQGVMRDITGEFKLIEGEYVWDEGAWRWREW